MPDTMSEREIEDVVNSVRRLVAQEGRRGRQPPLVLTPEMRVDAIASAQAPAPTPEPAATAPAAEPNAYEPPAYEPPAPEPAAGDAPGDATGDGPPVPPGAAGQPEGAAAAADAQLPEPVAPGQGMLAIRDEEALQALVAQIVRDELHGKLGERITLAVRKLVRNEIARAMDDERRK